MKKLILLALLIPSLSFAQKFEVSEQAGYSITGPVRHLDGSFINQVAVGYHVIKPMAVSAFYETEAWSSRYNSFGIAVDYTAYNEYIGIDGMLVYATSYTNNYSNTSYNTSYGYGAHIGTKQRLCKRLYLIEEIGYHVLALKENITGYYYINNALTPVETSHIRQLNYAYLRIGLSYKF